MFNKKIFYILFVIIIIVLIILLQTWGIIDNKFVNPNLSPVKKTLETEEGIIGHLLMHSQSPSGFRNSWYASVTDSGVNLQISFNNNDPEDTRGGDITYDSKNSPHIVYPDRSAPAIGYITKISNQWRTEHIFPPNPSSYYEYFLPAVYLDNEKPVIFFMYLAGSTSYIVRAEKTQQRLGNCGDNFSWICNTIYTYNGLAIPKVDFDEINKNAYIAILKVRLNQQVLDQEIIYLEIDRDGSIQTQESVIYKTGNPDDRIWDLSIHYNPISNKPSIAYMEGAPYTANRLRGNIVYATKDNTGNRCLNSMTWDCFNVESINDLYWLSKYFLGIIQIVHNQNGDNLLIYLGESVASGINMKWTSTLNYNFNPQTIALVDANMVYSSTKVIPYATDSTQNGKILIFYISPNLNPNLAQYVGTSGTGCLSNSWKCNQIYGAPLNAYPNSLKAV